MMDNDKWKSPLLIGKHPQFKGRLCHCLWDITLSTFGFKIVNASLDCSSQYHSKRMSNGWGCLPLLPASPPPPPPPLYPSCYWRDTQQSLLCSGQSGRQVSSSSWWVPQGSRSSLRGPGGQGTHGGTGACDWLQQYTAYIEPGKENRRGERGRHYLAKKEGWNSTC